MEWKMGKLTVAMLITLVTLVTLPVPSPAQTGAAATLSVLAPPVERVGAGAAGTSAGVDGMNLAEGDRIKTGAGGLALITFLDGSTVTVLSDAEVTVKQTGAERGNSGIRMLIHAGRVWARVVQAAGRRSSPLSLESNEYTATAHDGLIGAERVRQRLRVLDPPRRAPPHRPERADGRGADARPARARRLRVARRAGALRAERERARGPDLGPGPAPAAHAGRPHRRGLSRREMSR